MVNLTIKDLVHDKKKVILVCLGLMTSILLVLFGAGMLNGTVNDSAMVIDRSSADAWIAQKNRGNLLYGSYLSEELCDNLNDSLDSSLYLEKFIYTGAMFDFESKTTSGQICGINISSNLIKPWDIVSGNINDLNTPLTTILDVSFKNFLPGIDINDEILINGYDVRIIGFCKNAKWFVNPFAWMSLETSQIINKIGNGTSFLLIKYNSESEYNIDQLKTDLNDVEGIEIYSSSQISSKTKNYMLYESGAGTSVGIMVAMGLFVCLIIIFLTMYSSVNEKTAEFGTLKAVGASKGLLYKMLIGQVGLLMTISYIFGTILTYIIGFLIADMTSMPIKLNISLIMIFYSISLLVGIFAVLLAIRKVNKIDPIIVFKS